MSCSCVDPLVGDGPSVCSCTQPGLLGPPIVSKSCAGRVAPHGYKYRLVNGDCILVNASSGMPVIDTAPVPVAASTVDNIKNWALANPLLALGVGGALYYFLTKD